MDREEYNWTTTTDDRLLDILFQPLVTPIPVQRTPDLEILIHDIDSFSVLLIVSSLLVT